MTAAVLDLATMGERWGHPFQAVLGKEVFNALVVDIDFPHRRIAFRNRQNFRVPTGAHRVVLGQYLAMYTLPVSLDDRPAVPAMFDLGNGSPLIVGPTYPGQGELVQTRPNSQALNGAVGGTRVDIVTTVNTVSVGGFVFRDVPTFFPPLGKNIFNSNRVFANVGLPVFSRFRVICDLPNDALYLVPDDRLVKQPFLKDRSGLQFSPTATGWKVIFVAPGGPAAEQGIKANDIIVAINGQPTHQIPMSGAQAWRWGETGDQISLTLSDGSTHRFRLRDYF